METFSQLILLYYEINNIYLELRNLELEGKKGSDFFLQLVSILKEKLQEEEKLFELLYNSDEYDAVCDLILKEDNPMFMRLRDYVNVYEATNIPIYEDDDEATAEKKEMMMIASKMYSACNRNTFLIYSSFLQECIDSNELLKDRLLNLKYYNSFTKHDMEKSLIDCNFSVAEVNVVDLYLVARTLDINFKLRDEIILDGYLNTIINMIEILLSIKDDERDDIDKMALSLNTECLLKACLSLLSDRDYKKIRNKVFDKISELSNNKNNISVDIISSYIENRKKYKSRVRKISAGPISGD